MRAPAPLAACLLAAALAMPVRAAAPPAAAAAPPGQAQPRYAGRIALPAGQTRLLRHPGVDRVAVGDGHVLDVKVLEDAGQVLLIGRKPGLTDLRVWVRGRERAAYLVEVTPPAPEAVLEEVRARIGDIEGVRARVAGGKVILEGAALREEDHARIETLAREHAGTVVNEVAPPRVPLRAMVEFDARVLEVSRNLSRTIGIEWLRNGARVAGDYAGPRFGIIGTFQGNAAFRPPPGGAFGVTAPLGYETTKSFFGWDSLIESRLRLLETHGYARQLANPRLVCRSGGKAEFLAGGEVPIVVTTGLGLQDVVYKQYGIRLIVEPDVDPAGYVATQLTVEVSDIDEQNTKGDFPAFLTRRTTTEVNLGRGQTLVISGLLRNSRSKAVTKLPGLGHLPVLGELFKSRRFRDDETELLVLLTPRIVDARSAHNREGIRRYRELDRAGLQAVRFRLMD